MTWLPAMISWLLMTITVLASLAVVFSRSPIHAALSLIVSLLSVAGLYMQLSAYFLSVVQILIYAGGILVLFIYLLMLLGLLLRPMSRRRMLTYMVLFFTMMSMVFFSLIPSLASPQWRLFFDIPSHFGTIEGFAKALLQNYALAFELMALLLLAALVGVVYLTRREE